MKCTEEKENNEKKENTEVLVDPELTIICKHCGQPIEQVKLMGLSLICPVCGKPQNGQPHMIA